MPLNVDKIETIKLFVCGTEILPGGSSLYETGSGICWTQRVDVCNEANGCYSVVSGGEKNTIGTFSSYCNDPIYGSTIGGGSCNTISSYSAYYESYGNTIAGGTCNTTVSSYYNGQTIGGGVRNVTLSNYSTVSGGYVAGALGYVPLYKDIKKIQMEFLYGDMNKISVEGKKPSDMITGAKSSLTRDFNKIAEMRRAGEITPAEVREMKAEAKEDFKSKIEDIKEAFREYRKSK